MATGKRLQDQNANKRPSYEKMIAAAIASNNYSKRGVSRQRIANYIRKNYNVPRGSLFKSAVLSALKWGIDSGLWCFGETKRRYKFIDHKDKLKKQRRRRRHQQRLSKNRKNTSKQENRNLRSTFIRLSEREIHIQKRIDQLDSVLAIFPTESDMARTARSSIRNDDSNDTTDSRQQTEQTIIQSNGNQINIISSDHIHGSNNHVDVANERALTDQDKNLLIIIDDIARTESSDQMRGCGETEQERQVPQQDESVQSSATQIQAMEQEHASKFDVLKRSHDERLKLVEAKWRKRLDAMKRDNEEELDNLLKMKKNKKTDNHSPGTNSLICSQTEHHTDSANVDVPANKSKFHIALCQQVKSAGKISDLLGILDRMPFSDVKDFLRDSINETGTDDVRTVYHNLVSINEILSDNVLQCILSFGHCNQNRTVCQLWNRLNQQNEENILRVLYDAVDDQTLGGTLGPLPQGMSILIVHPSRSTLTPLEIRRGYTGPLTSLHNAIYDNRRVLLHPGSYRYKDLHARFQNVQHIGLGNGCSIEFKDGFVTGDKAKLHFVNIRCIISGNVRLPLESAVVFERCTFQIMDGCSLVVEGNTCLDIRNCHFQAHPTIIGNPNTQKAIYIRTSAQKVCISESTFSDFACCVIIFQRGRLCKDIQITNNRFHNTTRYPKHVVALIPHGISTDEVNAACLLHGNTSTNTLDPNIVHIARSLNHRI